MKKIITLLLLLIFGITFNSFAQVTKNPLVNRTKAKHAEIIEVSISPDETFITLKLSSHYDKLVKIKRKCHIEYFNPQKRALESKKIRRLYNLNGENLALDYNHVPYDELILEFPPLPQGVTKINVIVDSEWKWYGVNINPRKDRAVERIAYNIKEIDSLIIDSKSPFAGVYEHFNIVGGTSEISQLAYVKKNGNIYLLYVTRDIPRGTWVCGDIKAILHPTAANYLFKADWFMTPKSVCRALITFGDGHMKVLYDQKEEIYIKMPNGDIDNNSWDFSKSEIGKWNGTGFALGKGYIVTNSHVTDGASNIEIYGVNGDFSKGYRAIVVGTDKAGDLSLLKIENEEIISSWPTPPYSIKTSISDVGENVFALGYPLISTMGEEIKLTNGIISARSGFEGDVSTYQISVPIQPGNSGGPMFDEEGCLVGIICAKHKGTENVGYAIKTSYLINLVESVADKRILPQTNMLKGKSLKEQVKCIRGSVYLIECTK